jgi:hypothetical protein
MFIGISIDIIQTNKLIMSYIVKLAVQKLTLQFFQTT